MKQQQAKERKQFASVIVAAQTSSAAKRKHVASDKGLSKKQKKAELPADPPDKGTLKKAVLYFSAASKLAALTTEELEQFLATNNKPV
jgi:hypothetical protein